jgi:hypothetical protein
LLPASVPAADDDLGLLRFCGLVRLPLPFGWFGLGPLALTFGWFGLGVAGDDLGLGLHGVGGADAEDG